MNCKGNKHIKWEDRLKIEGVLRAGAKPAEIAAMLGKCKNTIYNELVRGMCVQQTSEYEFIERYCADVAERKYQENLRAKGPDLLYKGGHVRGPDHTMESVVRALDRMERRMGAKFREVFRTITAAEVAQVEEWLANYPRRILDWKTPQILFDEYMTVAA